MPSGHWMRFCPSVAPTTVPAVTIPTRPPTVPSSSVPPIQPSVPATRQQQPPLASLPQLSTATQDPEIDKAERHLYTRPPVGRVRQECITTLRKVLQ